MTRRGSSHALLSFKALAVAITVGLSVPVRAQAPGTVLPGPTDSAEYAARTEKQIEAAKALIGALPNRQLSEPAKAAAEFSLEQVKQLNQARARAEAISANPQNAFLPKILTEPEAKFTSRDREYVINLGRGDLGTCGANRSLACNGTPVAGGIVECGIGVPDRTMPSGFRNVGIVLVQCKPNGKFLDGAIVAMVAANLNEYHGPHARAEGRFITYTGNLSANFCTPCPAPR